VTAAVTSPVRAAVLRTEIVPAAALAQRPGAWDDLARRAAAPSVEAGRRMVEAHRAHGLAPADLACVTVRRGGDLVALLPFRIRSGPLGVASPFTSPYVTATLPLVAAGDGPEILAALAEGLARAGGGRAWWWPLLPDRAPVGPGLLAALEERGWRRVAVDAFARPVLHRRASLAAFAAEHPRKGRLKDLRRRERRLAEAGEVVVESVGPDGDLAAAVEAFLALERAGWKGRAGTALACRPDTAAFARALFRPADDPVVPRADLLRLDGRPIAASLSLVGGGTAVLLKTAYDETRPDLAPGVLLEHAIVRAVHDTAFADTLDSATLDSPVLAELYPDRETVAEWVLAPPGAWQPPEAVAAAIRWRHLARDWVRKRRRP
jgi:CelD/BcsL family acetyltransferase involved in cellulose biosynthesis